ncbi:uncharacterized protein N7459_005382 [Penicillium hispanicum]|uniref:uncharacterized protein n=1 Tax=Penicillium hispanicum TaxID=1080232 RepID=UPI0025417FD0|nr:uncharacterized protein N7459_005382 [Penicillium hispanicum]KAJ5585582.1 hypothetical protein N7459_005382 [Penicillium hispanicum]
MTPKRTNRSPSGRCPRLRLRLSPAVIKSEDTDDVPPIQHHQVPAASPPVTTSAENSHSPSSDSAPSLAPPPTIRSRVLSESDISVLDLGPSLTNTHLGRDHEPYLHASHMMGGALDLCMTPRTIIRLRTRAQAISGGDSLDGTQRLLRTDDLESVAVTSDSASVNNDHSISLYARRHDAVHNISGMMLPSIPVPLTGDIHSVGYGYGFDGYNRSHFFIAGDPEREISQLAAESTPRPMRALSFRAHRSFEISDEDFVVARDAEVARQEQRMSLFPNVVIDKSDGGTAS